MDLAELEKMTVPKLKEELKKRGLPLTGLKAELKARLIEALNAEQVGCSWVLLALCAAQETRETFDFRANQPHPQLLCHVVSILRDKRCICVATIVV